MFALGSPLVESYDVKRLLVCMQVTSGTSASAYKTQPMEGDRSFLQAEVLLYSDLLNRDF